MDLIGCSDSQSTNLSHPSDRLRLRGRLRFQACGAGQSLDQRDMEASPRQNLHIACGCLRSFRGCLRTFSALPSTSGCASIARTAAACLVEHSFHWQAWSAQSRHSFFPPRRQIPMPHKSCHTQGPASARFGEKHLCARFSLYA